MRQFLHIVIPLLLPLLLWLLWQVLARGGLLPGWWRSAPWPWIIGVGCGMAALSLILWGLLGGEPKGGTYQPPRVENGEILPGRVVR